MFNWFSKKNAQPEKAHKCSCCGYYTVYFHGDICPVCFWEKDMLAGPHEPSSANHGLTLTQARQNYQSFGACEKEMLKHVRAPKPEELTGIDD